MGQALGATQDIGELSLDPRQQCWRWAENPELLYVFRDRPSNHRAAAERDDVTGSRGLFMVDES